MPTRDASPTELGENLQGGIASCLKAARMYYLLLEESSFLHEYSKDVLLITYYLRKIT